MNERRMISGIEAANIYAETFAKRTTEYNRLKNRSEQIESAVTDGETAIAQLVELGVGLPEEFSQRVHEAEIALRAVRSYKDRHSN